jgi:hypothetical protein
MPSMKYLWVNRYSIINGISVRVAAAIIRCVSLSYLLAYHPANIEKNIL